LQSLLGEKCQDVQMDSLDNTVAPV